MSNKTKTRDMLIDGEPFKQISIKNKSGESTKFKPIGKGIKSGMHIVESNHEQSHFDVYDNEKEIDKDRTFKPRPAGVAIHLDEKEAKFSTLPPILVREGELDGLSTIEKLEEYVKRVKFVKKIKSS